MIKEQEKLLNLSQVGKGVFTRCYELNENTVLLESYDPIKKVMADGLFPKSRLFPEVVNYSSPFAHGGSMYTMKYYKGRPARSTKTWLHKNLLLKEYELYLLLNDLTNRVTEHLKGKRNIDRDDVWQKAFKEIPNKKLSSLLVKAHKACLKVTKNVALDCFPKNVTAHRGKLILLDCFYSPSVLYKVKFNKDLEWALDWK